MDPDDDGSGSDQDPDTGDDEEVPLVEEPEEITLYLNADWSLSRGVPASGHIEQGDFLPDYFQGNIDPADWMFRTDPLPNATIVHQDPVLLTLWIESDTPHTPFPGFEEVGAVGMFGSTRGTPLSAFDFDGSLYTPGEPVEFQVPLEFNDYVPIVTPAGESFALFAAFAATTTDAAPARILVGEDFPSSISFTMSNLTRDPTDGLPGSPEVESFTGTIENPESPRPEHTFELAQDTTELHVEIELTGGTHENDLDIDLYDAGGKHISGGHTPATFESIYLLGPALDGLHGTTLSVQVGHFTPVNAEYEITVSQR